VAGGFSSSSPCKRCVCDPSDSSRQVWALPLSSQAAQHQWTRLPDLLRARSNFNLVRLNGRLLVVGSGSGVVEEWDMEGKKMGAGVRMEFAMGHKDDSHRHII